MQEGEVTAEKETFMTWVLISHRQGGTHDGRTCLKLSIYMALILPTRTVLQTNKDSFPHLTLGCAWCAR